MEATRGGSSYHEYSEEARDNMAGDSKAKGTVSMLADLLLFLGLVIALLLRPGFL